MSLADPNAEENTSLQVGCRVVDRDADPESQDEMVVINKPKIPINNWYGSNDALVADTNPDYPETDNAVVTVYISEFKEKYGYVYTGYLPLQIRDAHRQDLQTYSFPESRLQVISEPNPTTVSLEKVLPSPYHTRQFSAAENTGLIERLENTGHVFGTVIARPKENSDYFELMNGHKRVWAATIVDGIETVDIEIHPATDLWAARKFARFHLGHPENHPGAYTGSLREKAIQRMDKILQGGASNVFDVIDDIDFDTTDKLSPGEHKSNSTQ